MAPRASRRHHRGRLLLSAVRSGHEPADAQVDGGQGVGADRLAVDTLEVRPADRLLEVGCGHGVAVALRLRAARPRERYTAIDRSAKMIALATRRNRERRRGKAMLEAVALRGDPDLGDQRFDKVFAFNVAPFWLQPRAAFGAVQGRLAPDGAFYLFWDARHAAPGRAPGLSLEQVSEGFALGGFSVDRVLVRDLRPVPAVCVIGRPQGG